MTHALQSAVILEPTDTIHHTLTRSQARHVNGMAMRVAHHAHRAIDRCRRTELLDPIDTRAHGGHAIRDLEHLRRLPLGHFMLVKPLQRHVVVGEPVVLQTGVFRLENVRLLGESNAGGLTIYADRG